METGQVVYLKAYKQLALILKRFESGIYAIEMLGTNAEMLATEDQLTIVPGITIP